jgi:hypothetical protein
METCEVRIDVPGDHLSHISTDAAFGRGRRRIYTDALRKNARSGDQRGVLSRACVVHASTDGK